MSQPVTLVQFKQAISKVHRRSEWPLMSELERDEPVLTEHLLEELTSIHHELYHLGLPHKRLQRVGRRMRRLCLVIVLSLKAARDPG